MVSNLRRLAKDHAALHGDKLPPYYVLPPDDGRLGAADDLSQLNVLITGPPGTPYAEGLWRLHLKMPEDYPKSPPKATFRTKIWHPNVEENTGAVCVDTLKRDWQSSLTLRDVLVTISCLLIHPNPDSALNASAGTLLREDYEAFAHQAKLMTSIHAPIQPALHAAVKEAKYRGDDPKSIPMDQDELQNPRPRKQPRLRSNIPKKTVRRLNPPDNHLPPAVVETSLPTLLENNEEDDPMHDSENESLAASGKENDPSLSPTPVLPAPPSPRKITLGKRPLSVISTSYPDDPDADMMVIDSESEEEAVQVSPSARNITANLIHSRQSPSPQRTAPKLALSKGNNTPFRLRDDVQIYEDFPDRTRYHGKENRGSGLLGLKERPDMQATALGNGTNPLSVGMNPQLPAPSISPRARHPSKVTKKVVGGARKPAGTKSKPRIGVRRL
ncbi:hypothetical protein F1880_005832 [Penicillium rolfsii]|nr:hypothetical protein F1880_005832 [Penicillium rolfsii]